MEATNAQFKDYIGDSLKIASGLLKTVYQERSQLYGSFIKLMLDKAVDEFTINVEEGKFISENYSLEMVPDEKGENLTITLVKHEVVEDES